MDDKEDMMDWNNVLIERAKGCVVDGCSERANFTPGVEVYWKGKEGEKVDRFTATIPMAVCKDHQTKLAGELMVEENIVIYKQMARETTPGRINSNPDVINFHWMEEVI